jgi:hypothetical protein
MKVSGQVHTFIVFAQGGISPRINRAACVIDCNAIQEYKVKR